MLLSLSFGVVVSIIVITTLVGVILGWTLPIWLAPCLIIIGLFFIVLGAIGIRTRSVK